MERVSKQPVGTELQVPQVPVATPEGSYSRRDREQASAPRDGLAAPDTDVVGL